MNDFNKLSLEMLSTVYGISKEISTLEDIANDIITPWKYFNIIQNTSRKMRFKSFLNTLSTKLTLNNQIDYNDVERIQNYLKNDQIKQFFIDQIDAALNTKSLNCSAILYRNRNIFYIFELILVRRPFY